MLKLIKLNTAIKNYIILNKKILDCENQKKIVEMKIHEAEIFKIINTIDDLRRSTGIKQEKIMEMIGEDK